MRNDSGVFCLCHWTFDVERSTFASIQMNDFLLSILLGIVEGLTEFLPVSSTGHLRIGEALFKLNLGDSFWKMYTIVIQLGAIVPLPAHFRNRIRQFLRTLP